MSDFLYTDLRADDGDLTVSPQGDLDTVSGVDNLTQALQRRFNTPIGALFYDTSYGNPLYDRLSQPMGQDFERLALADARACLLQDIRVQSVQVDLTVNREQRTLSFHATFIAKDGTTGSIDQEVSLRV